MLPTLLTAFSLMLPYGFGELLPKAVRTGSFSALCVFLKIMCMTHESTILSFPAQNPLIREETMESFLFSAALPCLVLFYY